MGLGFQFLLDGSDLPYSKGFVKLECSEPSTKVFDFLDFLFVGKAFDPVHKRVVVRVFAGIESKEILQAKSIRRYLNHLR